MPIFPTCHLKGPPIDWAPLIGPKKIQTSLQNYSPLLIRFTLEILKRYEISTTFFIHKLLCYHTEKVMCGLWSLHHIFERKYLEAYLLVGKIIDVSMYHPHDRAATHTQGRPILSAFTPPILALLIYSVRLPFTSIN